MTDPNPWSTSQRQGSILLELAIIICMSLYNPVLATYRLEHTPAALLGRTLTAWSISSGVSIAVLSALAGVLADVTGTRTALLVAGVLILFSPMLLTRLPPEACAEIRPQPEKNSPA